jgi:glucan 1,3-beta-glucosidase
MPATERDRRNSDRERHQRRKGHRYNDSTSELLPSSPRHQRRDSESQSPRKERPRKKRYHYPEDETTESSNALSAGALGELDALNVGDVRWNSNGGIQGVKKYRTAEEKAERRERRERREQRRRERGEGAEDRHRERRKQPRVVSGTYLERGAEPYDEKVVLVDQRARLRGGAGSVESDGDEARRRKRRRIGESCLKERRT